MSQGGWQASARARSGAKAIGAYALRMLDAVARARGFATTQLLTEWPAVVGEELAQFTMPDRLIWPRRTEEQDGAATQRAWRTEGATLVLKVDGPRAIEVQHRADQILERVNVYFGYRAVAQLRFLQAPVARAAPKRPPAPPPPLQEAVLPASASFADKNLAKALMRLGASLRGKGQKP